jgi:hypothetical protein
MAPHVMKTPYAWSPAEHRLACLAPIAETDAVDEATRFLLLNCVETYLELNENDWKEYALLLEDRKFPRLEDIEMTWGDRKMAEGRAQGRVQGQLEGRRQMLLEQLESRFGELSPTARRGVQALTSEDELGDLARRVLDARSLEELGLA